MAASSSPLLSVGCPACGERLGVRAADVGRRGKCRQCGKVFRIVGEKSVAPVSAKPPAAADLRQAAGAKPQAAAAPGPPVMPQVTTVTFPCELCATRLTAHLTEIGKAMKCPDCGRRNVIPLPTPVVPIKPPAAMSGEQYGLWDVDEAHDVVLERTPTLHPVECHLCQTLMYATDAQVGKRLKCPDCGSSTLATARAAVKPRGPVLVPDGDEYQLDEATAPGPRPVYRPVELRGVEWKRGEEIRVEAESGDGDAKRDAPPLVAEATQSERGGAKPQARTGAPRWPLIFGVWRMLFTSEVLVRWVMLSITLTIAGWFLSWVFNAMGKQVFLALPMFAIGCVLSGFWLLAALPAALAIVTESSEGNDRLHDPPQFMSFAFAEAFFVVIAAAVSAIPAWLTFKIPTAWSVEAHVALSAAAWLGCFPIVLLSNLEQSSAFAVFSPRLGSSVLRCAGPWALFYFESALLAAAVGGATWAIALSGKPGWWLVAPWLVVAALFIYMRLLGRLAWWIAELTPALDEAKRA